MSARSAGFGTFGHLARRFAGSLSPAGPPVGEEAWARRWLSPAQQGLWGRMSGADRRHAVGVARQVATQLGTPDGTGVPTPVLAAALLHDMGKIESGLGTFGRVAATVVAMGVGRERVAAWAPRRRGWRGRFGRYVTHDRIGARLLADAGSDVLTTAWAAEHHWPEDRWTVDRPVALVLKAADDD